ncbi:MAG: iron ABC transporter permease [Reyranella sp.]|uniref:ABC transporter permease n=1 Tax=Reyranella sp. TaxID=1929291 RepID=UPI0012261420|nr:iron ABC transporter permease [Reyranella sp.]TAJ96466.1 MAG: iron ABC transporter permease [Reyranella sp.]TBR26433.1 MAG: iron ABC transporter permease [Reyranella sp.]
MIWRLGAVAVAAIVALPLLGIVSSLFSGQGELWRHLVDTQLRDIVGNTIVLLLGVGLGTVVIGTGTAWLVTTCRFPGVGLLQWALLLPLVLPTYIIGYAYADLLAFAGPLQTSLRGATGWSRADYWFPDLGSAAGVAFLFTLVLYPYVYLAARASFLTQSQALLEASRILGNGPWRTFLRIGLPLARPAIAAGAALALLETLADFGTVQYYGVHTFTTAIYRTWYGMGNREGAAQISLVLIAIAVALILIERHSRGRASFAVASNLRHRSEPAPLPPVAALAALVACALPVLLGFVLPTVHLAQLALTSGAVTADHRFIGDGINSLILATLAAIIIVSLALFLSYAGRLVRRRALNRTIEFASLGYAIPGAVIAVGVLLPLAVADRGIDLLSRGLFGLPTGLLLSGTAFALLLAYTVRFLAVGIASIAPGLAAIDPAMDASARVLGARPNQVLRYIHMPMLRAPALTAGIIAFVEVLKELPATLLIRPFNFDTLAIGVFRFASDERLAQAAVGAIVIVLVSLVPVILLSHAVAAGSPARGQFTSSPPDP